MSITCTSPLVGEVHQISMKNYNPPFVDQLPQILNNMGESEKYDLYQSSWQSLNIKVDREVVGGSRCRILYVNVAYCKKYLVSSVSTNFVTSSL